MTTRNRRGLIWADFSTERQSLAAATGSTHPVVITADGGASLRNYTITRIIHKVTIIPDAANVTANVYHALVLVNSDAAAAGSFPDPQTMTEQPGWIYRDMTTVATPSAGASNVEPETYDIRGQRLFRNQELGLYFIIRNEAAAIGVQYNVYTRVLCKMP